MYRLPERDQFRLLVTFGDEALELMRGRVGAATKRHWLANVNYASIYSPGGCVCIKDVGRTFAGSFVMLNHIIREGGRTENVPGTFLNVPASNTGDADAEFQFKFRLTSLHALVSQVYMEAERQSVLYVTELYYLEAKTSALQNWEIANL